MSKNQRGGIATEPSRRSGGFIGLGDPTRIDFRADETKPAPRSKPTEPEPVVVQESAAPVAVAEADVPNLSTEPAPTAVPALTFNDVAAIDLAEPESAPAVMVPAPVSQFEVAQARSLGVPFQNDVVSEPVAPADDLLARRDAEDAAGEADDLDLDGVPSSFFSPRAVLSQRGIVMLLAGAASLILLFAFTEVVALVNQIRGLPVVVQPFAYALVTLLSVAVVGTAGRLVWLYARLKQTPRVSVRARAALRERAVVRRQALEGLGSAEKNLHDFLLRYPVDTKAQQTRLTKLGFTGGEILKLVEAKENLLTAPKGSAVGWIDQLNRQFLQDLDAVARRRIRMYTKLVGFKTAAVPNGFLDTLIVLINAYLLVGDLCVIYNVRAGGWGTAGIMAHIFVNAFAAGKLDEWSGTAADQAAAALTHHGTSLMANAVKGVTKVAARAADGYINALLISRLGNATVYHLRPLVEPPSRA